MNPFLSYEGERLETAEPAAASTEEVTNFVNDLHEILQIFKYDLADHEAESVSRLISNVQTFSASIAKAQLTAIRSAMTFAVDSQQTNVITDFLKTFSGERLTLPEAVSKAGRWLSTKLSLN